jgi:Cu(I)/Ag(I) efflux system membrane fusion protein
VFLRGANGALAHHEITTGLIDGNDIEVLAGLAEGDVVVSSANFLIDAESSMGSTMGNSGDSAQAPAPAAAATGHDRH